MAVMASPDDYSRKQCGSYAVLLYAAFPAESWMKYFVRHVDLSSLNIASVGVPESFNKHESLFVIQRCFMMPCSG